MYLVQIRVEPGTETTQGVVQITAGYEERGSPRLVPAQDPAKILAALRLAESIVLSRISFGAPSPTVLARERPDLRDNGGV